MRRALVRGLGSLTLLLCAGRFSVAEPDAPRADFVFVNGAEPRTLDPQKMTGGIETRIADGIFEGLTFRDARTMRPVPGQAESWDVSPDGRRYTFRLRPSARWSNGDPVTAHDFVRAWRRLVDPAVGAEYAHFLYPVRHAEALHAHASDRSHLLGDPEAESAEEREGIIQGIRGLIGRHPGGVPARALQRLLDRRAWDGVIARVADPTLRALLARAEGVLTPSEGDALLAGMVAEAEARSSALEAARAHFGRDEGVFAIDDRTLAVELRSFTPFFLELTASAWLCPVHRRSLGAFEREAVSPDRIVTNGPFALEDWIPGERIRLRKSPTYWGAQEVGLETVDVLPTDDRTEAFALYSAGKVDWLPWGGPERLDELRATPGHYMHPAMILYFFRIHCTPPSPLADPRIRRALGLAVDRERLVETAARGKAFPATTLVPPGMPGYASPENGFRFDPETAQRLFREAGFPGGKGFPRLDLALNAEAGHVRIAQSVARDLEANLGVRVRLSALPWVDHLEAVNERRYDLARGGWIGDYRDPVDFLGLWTTRAANNRTGWGDPQFDRWIAWARDVGAFDALPAAERNAALDRCRDRPGMEGALSALGAAKGTEQRLDAAAALRMRLLREAEAMLLQEAFPVIPIYWYAASGIVRPGLEGFHAEIRSDDGRVVPNLEDLHPLRALRWARDR